MTASRASDAEARGETPEDREGPRAHGLEDHEGPWTVDELLDHNQHDRRSRIELVGGALIVSPSPAWPHQKASLRLAMQFESALVASDAPFEVAEAANVRTDDALFIPDIVVADIEAVRSGPVAVSMEDVLLVVEIVSPGNATMDRQLKPSAYAGLGLEHYWRLEPAAGTPELIVHTLAGGEYKETVRVTGTAKVPVGDHFVVELDVPALFRVR
ncbi:MAG: Uma2 family endonuclease [Streptomycetaceae bacterium]|jgi:Uma2 family endonuclease|nr:Uma2 family endonuclease [Streptomycetaceae bacterium]